MLKRCGKYGKKLTHLSSVSFKRDIGKQYNPEQSPQVAASDQGLHCLHLGLEFL